MMMGTRPFPTFLAVFMLLVTVHSPMAIADVVTLHDGRVFEGKILSDYGGVIEIDCMVHGIRSPLKFTHTQIKEFEIQPLPKDFFDAKPANKPAAQLDKKPVAALPLAKYAVLPLHGTMGEEIHADDVRDALDRIARTCSIVILEFDVDGGMALEAEMIADVLKEYDEKLEFISLIRNAVDAAVLPVLCADRILIDEGGTFGWTMSNQRIDYPGNAPGIFHAIPNGNSQGYAPNRSIQAATFVSTANRKGWNPDLVKAMTQVNTVLYGWEENGQRRVGPNPPANVVGASLIVDGSSTLTITSDFARQYGFPEVVPAGQLVADMGTLLAPNSRWKQGSTYGAIVQENALKQWYDFNENYPSRDGLMRAVNGLIQKAHAADPDRQIYNWTYIRQWNPQTRTTYSARVPTLTSWQKWYGSTDNSIDLWYRAGQNLERLAKIEGYAEYYYRTREYDYLELREEYKNTQREINRLRENRARGPVS